MQEVNASRSDPADEKAQTATGANDSQNNKPNASDLCSSEPLLSDSFDGELLIHKKPNDASEWSLPSDFESPLMGTTHDSGEFDKSFEVYIHEPNRAGDGISSHFVYQIDVKTSIADFGGSRFSVHRRFSDFLVLNDRLLDKYLHQGRIVPPPPGKDPLGTAKLKLQKSDKFTYEFTNRRRASLERYLNRIGRHPVIRLDEDFKQFICSPSPYQGPASAAARNSNLSGTVNYSPNAISQAGDSIRKVVNALTSGMSKIAYKVEEPDAWNKLIINVCAHGIEDFQDDVQYFDELQQTVDASLSWLRKLSCAFENLTTYRKGCLQTLLNLQRAVQCVSNCEECSSLCRSLSHFSDCLDKLQRRFHKQYDSDLYILAELAEDYVGLYGVVKQVLEERLKILTLWRAAEESLKTKRNSKLKLELAGKKDRIPQTELEIIECEVRLDRYKELFDNISGMIKSEMSRFDLYRVHDFQRGFISYVEQLRNFYAGLIKCWEDFIPTIEVEG